MYILHIAIVKAIPLPDLVGLGSIASLGSSFGGLPGITSLGGLAGMGNGLGGLTNMGNGLSSIAGLGGGLSDLSGIKSTLLGSAKVSRSSALNLGSLLSSGLGRPASGGSGLDKLLSGIGNTNPSSSASAVSESNLKSLLSTTLGNSKSGKLLSGSGSSISANPIKALSKTPSESGMPSLSSLMGSLLSTYTNKKSETKK